MIGGPLDASDGTTAGSVELSAVVAALGSMPAALDDVERIERIRQFETLKSMIAGAQAAETAAFAASQRRQAAAAGVPPDRQDRGIAAQIGLARSSSVHSAQRYVGFASILTRELPETFAALRAGRASEWRATLLARETMFLSCADRGVVDREFAPRLQQMSDRAVETETRKAAYQLDPEGSLARSRRAIGDRHVSIRPAPDTMVRLSTLAPVAQGVAAYAALCQAADTARSGGDPRTRGQVMTDTLIERVTGQATADGVAVEIELIIASDSLLAHPSTSRDKPDTGTPTHYADEADAGYADDTDIETDTDADDTDDTDIDDTDADDTDIEADETDAGCADETDARAADAPGLITAPGLTPMPIPAGLAREIVSNAAQAWLRRLFTAPGTGELVAMETHRRLFTRGQGRFIRFRDQYCATPYCGAPIRHNDHITPASRGGPTHTSNGRGQCETCNHATQAPGWTSRTQPDGTIDTTTPTGHTYRHPPPRPFTDLSTPTCGTPTPDSRIQALQHARRLNHAA